MFDWKDQTAVRRVAEDGAALAKSGILPSKGAPARFAFDKAAELVRQWDAEQDLAIAMTAARLAAKETRDAVAKEVKKAARRQPRAISPRVASARRRGTEDKAMTKSLQAMRYLLESGKPVREAVGAGFLTYVSEGGHCTREAWKRRLSERP